MGDGSSIDLVGTGNQFVFSATLGSATISDLDASDTFQFSQSTFGDWQSLLSHASQSGADTNINLTPTDSLLLKNVDLSTLTANRFRFA